MPFLIGVLWTVVQWIFREAVVKFILIGAIYTLLSVLLPILLSYITSYINGSALTSSFAGLSPGMWFFIDFARLDYGLPLLLSAAITVFIIRRIPFLK